MALDGILLRHIKNEIEKQALGARVSQIYQPNRDELIFVLRTFSGSKKLLLSARANSPRINFCKTTPENPEKPPMFCMLLRKRLGGGKLVGLRQNGCDRVLMLDFECVNELGDMVNITVVCEIMGMYSNVIIVDSDGIIIDSLRRVDLTVSSKRLVLPNLKYELPESQNKLNLLECSSEQAANEVINITPEAPLNKALLKTLEGVSPIVCREIEHRVNNGETNKLDDKERLRLECEIAELKNICESCSGEPYLVYRDDGKPMDFSFFKPLQYGSMAKVERFDGFSGLLDAFYEQRDARERMRVKSQSLIKLLNNTIERISRKIIKQQTELRRCTDREHLRICGDLLQANLYRIERGAPYVDIENFYDENNAVLRIKLNPALSPAANAQKYYKDYRKAKNAEIALKDQLKRGNEELRYIESVLDEAQRAESERELAQIREELTEQDYIKTRTPKKGKNKKARQSALPPLEFTSSEGFKILVGRNNRQNDLLTLKTAAKNDVWLHTKDIHGSHVIIVTDGKTPNDKTIYEAACLAALHSKARASSGVPVDYTLARYVSKPSGAKPGMVIYVNNKTVYADPSAAISIEN